MERKSYSDLPVLCWIPVSAEACVCYNLLYANTSLLQQCPIRAKSVAYVLLSQISQETPAGEDNLQNN